MVDVHRETNLFARARLCLLAKDPRDKLSQVKALARDWISGKLDIRPLPLPELVTPGQPPRPDLVHPRELPRRSLVTDKGRQAFIHALAHIEFNAINLACDALCRFRDMPSAYYDDWVRIASEEAGHFLLLQSRLRAEGCDYGDLPGHNGLWDMAMRTAHDPLARMALVPRMLEARGLDVTPGMIERFRALKNRPMVEILSRILADEIGHVEAGSRWFRYLCDQRAIDPENTFFDLLESVGSGEIRCPLNLDARRQAGFSDVELARLQRLCR
ncbi:MAG: ferritin-like domain-containing protein [Gammaproteobacteria bacterium]|nr:ferritin-like domain-containing protein [Gammaproteobacteria bacterium]